jgi:hypothetical protein
MTEICDQVAAPLEKAMTKVAPSPSVAASTLLLMSTSSISKAR